MEECLLASEQEAGLKPRLRRCRSALGSPLPIAMALAIAEPRWLDKSEREATLPKLKSYLLGNRSSRPRQVLNGNLLA
jgi:hypothetical protein